MNTKPEELFVVAGAFQINTMDDNRAIYTVKVSDFFMIKNLRKIFPINMFPTNIFLELK